MAVELEHISEEEYRRWLTPQQALFTFPHPLLGDSNAMALVNRANLGRVRTAAEHVLMAQAGEATEQEFALLPATFWSQDFPKWPGHFWSTGDHHTVLRTSPQLYINLTGVRFEPEGVEKLRQQLSDEPPLISGPEKQQNKGGAPRKGWWDDLWIEMIRRIRAGDLRPERRRASENYARLAWRAGVLPRRGHTEENGN